MIDKESLVFACDNLFDSKLGKEIESSVKRVISENNMLPLIKNGVAVGLSGGADSVLLLIILRKMQKELDFTLKALHVNHMIRGESADSDEEFSKDFSQALGIEYESLKADVPSYAKDNRLGTEEAAREIRYNFFKTAVERDERINTIATAHNSTDNLETFIFNFMRGSGIRGLGGIAPIRDNVIRPLIQVSKEDILKLLTDSKIPFVVDETNFSTEYTRNYIRHEILPKLKRLTPSPEQMSSKVISNIRSDAEYLELSAKQFFDANMKNGKIESIKLKSLHPAILSRVIRLMSFDFGAPTPEKIHVDKISHLIKSANRFEVDIPGKAKFISKDSLCYISPKDAADKTTKFEHSLSEGFNEISELNIGIAITSDSSVNYSSNVYKFSIQANLQSVIIKGNLTVRNKSDGDAYFYGGMTRKVKKLFCDKKIPLSKRETIPIITDEKGIIWIPGFGVRDDSPTEKTNKWVTIYEKII